jgi:glucose uptake protein GlcU
MNEWKYLIGLALILIGAILLVVCFVFEWQSNTELILGLSFIIIGYILHLWLLKRAKKY